MFREVVQEAFDLYLVKPEELATKFEVAKSTVLKWARGTAEPHRLIRIQVLEYLMQRTKVWLGRDD